MSGLTRRDFFTGLAVSVPASLWSSTGAGGEQVRGRSALPPIPAVAAESRLLDLSPAQWIWYPSQRCLPNTFIFFRRPVVLEKPVRSARGWICADSRYRLHVNGARIQWGPAPSDPRWMEADPLDLTDELRPGSNVIGATVLFYGHGDGTWPTGKPGFILRLVIDHPDGSSTEINSDASWQTCIARSWRPGQYKRWFVRALQEEFDARIYPRGWDTISFTPDGAWRPAMPLPDASASEPPITSRFRDHAQDLGGERGQCELRPRSIPFMRESLMPAGRLVESHVLLWKRSPIEYFECLSPDAFTVERRLCATPAGLQAWDVLLEQGTGSVLTFEFAEQAVGFPFFTIDAPEGTTIELMVHEYHEPGTSPLLNTHYHSWTRFVCAAGINRFETFDYEAAKWLQLHIHDGTGTARISDVGLRRREYPWPATPEVQTSDAVLNTLVRASLNTLNNSIHEVAVDGMGRERQQYSGDGSHQLHAVYLAFGETRLPGRFVTTFSQGITEEGYFLDCWPAYDRLARLWERQLQVSYWGPLIDHGVGFGFDCFHYYMYTGDRNGLGEAFPRLLRFFTYLRTLRRDGGLLPVEGLGVPSVYIDHLAYKKQRHKQCAFNLYASAMMEYALAPLCRAFREDRWHDAVRQFGLELLAATRRTFWDRSRGAFVANLPWAVEEKEFRYCDRSLALGILYDLCPGGRTAPSLALLSSAPADMGLSYPANACWRLWALAKGGKPDAILSEFRSRWASMESVQSNNTLQEFWKERPDGGSVMSHSCPVPLYMLFMGIAGIQPIAPGFSRCMIRPQLGDLERLALTTRTVKGDIVFTAMGSVGSRELTVTMPPGCTGELTVSEKESLPLEPWPTPHEAGLRRYILPPGQQSIVTLFHT